MIQMVARAPASSHQHIDNGASDDDFEACSTFLQQSNHTITSDIYCLTAL